MNRRDKKILNDIKDDLCKHLFKKGCKSARNWEWHHQLGKTKEIQACGNIKEAFDEIKNCMCIPIPKNFHCMLHAFKPRYFYIGINYNATLFNKIARKCIYDEYCNGTVNNTILKKPIATNGKNSGCAYEFSKGGNAKANFCKQIKVPCVPSTTNWGDLFVILGI